MDSLSLVLLLSIIVSTLFLLRRKRWKLPPGPTPLPIIGNILQLGTHPHHRLAQLSKTYGDLMYLKLGSIHTIVASSPQTAKLILQQHDHICSARPVPHTVRAMDHHQASLAFLSVGTKWRHFRKISREHIFAQHKLLNSEALRQQKLHQLRHYLNHCCATAQLVDIEEASFLTALNLMSATLFSMDFATLGSPSSHHQMKMKEAVQGLINISGVTSIVDFFPVFRFLDPQGLGRKSKAYFATLLSKFDEIIGQRLVERAKSAQRKKDLLEVLLDLHQENDSDLSLHDIKHLLIDLFLAGPDTTMCSVQWAMAELLSNPEKMMKAKTELRNVIGDGDVRESDIPKLPYLNAVIKESFRRHPPGSLLIPHEAESNVEINGYIIPRGARILVNVWAIGRDPTVWSNPDSFEPERFLGSKVDYKGQDFELIPFGSGRRMCPGLPLAHLMLHLMLATMIHYFDWRVEHGNVDLNEVFGLLIHKAVPLKAYPTEAYKMAVQIPVAQE